MIAIDTNLLIYAHRPGLPEHRVAARLIEEACYGERRWGIPSPCLAEFWSVVTRSEAWSRASTPQEAQGFLNQLVRSGAVILEPETGVGRRILGLAADLELSGRRIFDLQIALIALEAGARELWTADRGFVRIPGLVLRHPI